MFPWPCFAAASQRSDQTGQYVHAAAAAYAVHPGLQHGCWHRSSECWCLPPSRTSKKPQRCGPRTWLFQYTLKGKMVSLETLYTVCGRKTWTNWEFLWGKHTVCFGSLGQAEAVYFYSYRTALYQYEVRLKSTGACVHLQQIKAVLWRGLDGRASSAQQEALLQQRSVSLITPAAL